MAEPLSVLVACPGVSHVTRGYETFSLEVVAALAADPALDVSLLHGSGEVARVPRRRVWCLRRDRPVAQTLARLIPRSRAAYELEQLTFLPGLALRARRADVVFVSDQLLARGLAAVRRFGRGRFAIALSNGAPYPGPFPYADRVQQLTPVLLETATSRGEPAERMELLPYGFAGSEERPPTAQERSALKRALGLPLDQPLVLSVGALNRWQKRHDVLITAISKVRTPSLRLALLGAAEDETPRLRELAEQLLPGRVTFATVDPSEVTTWLRAADAFALASIDEGFGRAYVEAGLAGLPCIVHDGPVQRFVLGRWGAYVDMDDVDELATAIESSLASPPSEEFQKLQQEDLRSRFGWPALVGRYAVFLQSAARTKNPRTTARRS